MTPRHDPPRGRKPRASMAGAGSALARALALRGRRRRPGSPGQPGSEPCPVTPDRPLDLSGGAAATLAFDA